VNTKLLYQPANLLLPPSDIADAAKYCLHRMYVGRALGHTLDHANRETSFTRLYSVLLQDVAPNYSKALAWLSDNDLILSDNHYVVGKKSTGYRWAMGYEDAVRVPCSARLSKKITKRSRRTFRAHTVAHKHLVRWACAARLDRAGALAYVQSAKLDLESLAASLLTDSEYRQTLRMTIELIHSEEWEHTVCDFGRFHTPFTRLLSELRAFVSFNGQKLTNVDLSNSQPLVLVLLFPRSESPQGPQGQNRSEDHSESAEDHSGRDAGEENGEQDTEKESVGHCSGSRRSPSQSPSSYMLLKERDKSVVRAVDKAINHDNQCARFKEQRKAETEEETDGPTKRNQNTLPADMEQYRSDCESGQFYEKLMQRVGVHPEGRGQFKKDVFREIYYGKAWEDTALRRAYIETYPNVWKLIVKQKAGNYRKLAWAMQREESRLMIDTVCYRFATEFADVPIITVHDSILTTAEHVELVCRVIREEFAKAGISPTIKTTSYAPAAVAA
jgi:hypothetical protein